MGYEAALRWLSRSAGKGILGRCLRGPLRGVAEIYIPYRLYKVTADDRANISVRCYAVDAAVGTLDPYEFVTPPEPDAWVEVETRNFHPLRLSESRTRTALTEKVRRLLYSRGFFRLANPRITAELIKPQFYMPYWAGFYGDEKNISVTVLSAVRQTVEGGKVRRLVEAWLLERDSHQELKLAF